LRGWEAKEKERGGGEGEVGIHVQPDGTLSIAAPASPFRPVPRNLEGGVLERVGKPGPLY
jgi:hypothetical protein